MDCSLEDFRAKIMSENQAIRRVSEIANAYLHRVRGRGTKKSFKASAGALNSKDIVFDHGVLSEAFKFWSEYDPKKKTA